MLDTSEQKGEYFACGEVGYVFSFTPNRTPAVPVRRARRSNKTALFPAFSDAQGPKSLDRI